MHSGFAPEHEIVRELTSGQGPPNLANMPARKSVRASGPKLKKIAEKWIFRPHRETRGKMAQKQEEWPQNPFWQFFLFLGHFSPIFAVRPKNPFSAIYLPILGRRPEPIFLQAGRFATQTPFVPSLKTFQNSLGWTHFPGK